MSDQIMDLYLENVRRQGLAEAAAADLVDVRPARRTVEKSPVAVQAVTPVPQDRVDELERRIAALENMLRPVLGKKPISEMEQIELDYIALGKTELTFHRFRTLPRVQRKKLLAGVGQ